MQDSISADAITQGLNTQFIGRRVVYYATIGSTNDVAKQLADAGEPEGTLVIADEQTAGRGRMARAWLAPARSSLLLSLILRPPLAPPQLPRATMAVALGACDAIRAETGLDAQLKWPNDVLLNDNPRKNRGAGKCAGILAEANIVGDRSEYVIVGLGVNVNFSARSVEGIPPDATTISDELGRSLPRAPLAQAILRTIESYYVRLKRGENLHDEWAARLVTLHESVRAQTPWGEEIGVAENVDEDGALLLRRADGTLVRLVAADVTLKRET
ncbi:MAG: biotin--[acetyl-CoA-carboxylase] ligase [Chloroflexi bacterium]|nr:biotin--[acetyl-CoA-carboxylase] ligase [Chloroflexota bacterium]